MSVLANQPPAVLANQPPAVLAVLVGLAVLGAVLVFGGARKAAHDAGRSVSLVGRVLLIAALIVGVQWAVLTRTPDLRWHLVVLALPALIAATVLTRALTLPTAMVKRGGRR